MLLLLCPRSRPRPKGSLLPVVTMRVGVINIAVVKASVPVRAVSPCA